MSAEKNTDEAIEEAVKNGFEVVYAEPNTLLIDLDDEASIQKFNNNLSILRDMFGSTVVRLWNSKSGNKHAVVTLLGAQLTDIERVALQTAMGSDCKRELLAIKRIRDGEKIISILFKPKGA